MSSLIVEVSRIQKVLPHPNAERLELAHVKGWQCVVPKGKYRGGDLVTYMPPDSVLPVELSDRIGVTKYLSSGRVRCAKLRGEPSFGVIVDRENDSWTEGMDVREHYGITKYSPPVKFTMGDQEPEHPMLARYTDVENMRNFPDVIREGEVVSVTEKIHGANSRIAMVREDNGEWVRLAGSRKQQRKEDGSRNAMFWYPWTLGPVANMMNDFAQASIRRQVVLFGEIYGKVQSLRYGQEGLSFAAFDLMLDGRYCNRHDFTNFCMFWGIPMVPELYYGPFDLSNIKSLAEGKTTMPGADHIREGVVVKPAIERTDPKIGRVILKYVGDGYLFGDSSDSDDQ